jgi:hypothetical protein
VAYIQGDIVLWPYIPGDIVLCPIYRVILCCDRIYRVILCCGRIYRVILYCGRIYRVILCCGLLYNLSVGAVVMSARYASYIKMFVQLISLCYVTLELTYLLPATATHFIHPVKTFYMFR